MESQVGGEAKQLAQAVAAQAMWEYYKENKAILIPDIREYRDYILELLMLGNSATKVFDQFVRVLEFAPTPCKSINGRKAGRSCKHLRAPWPFALH